ncbi:MAG: AraC family transcriptional regulator [Xanthomonadales bacterium]
MSIFAPALGALWKQLEGYGIDPAPVFREGGIDPEMLFDSGARVPLERFQDLNVRAQDLSGDPYFGLKSARYARPVHLGALGFAWLASSSLRCAFERLSRYSRVIQDKLMVELEDDGALFRVRVDARIPTLREPIREDGQLSVILRFCRTIAGEDFNPARVFFRQPEPENTAFHYELFRCPIEFGAAATGMDIRREDADRRLAGSNEELASLNEHIVVKYLAHREKSDIVNQVKATIIDALAEGQVTEQIVADALHMTARNLHRRLARHDTSFSQLLTETRKELARQYINDRSKTLTEISYLLGFAEVSSFSRAYKRWTGIPPSEARAKVA